MVGGFSSRVDMKRLTILSALLAVFGTGAVLWQRTVLSQARAGVGKLGGTGSTGDTKITDATLQQEIASLREQTKELPKLRNEISQLRAGRSELAAARAENARLLEAQQTGHVIQRAPPVGFVSRDNLSFTGYATPEATLQSFFWALREGNMIVAMQSMPDNDEELAELRKISPQERAKMEEQFKASEDIRMMKQFNDFGVAGREEISNDEVILYVRSSLSTNTFPHALKRFGNEWKITDMGAQARRKARRY
jgi:hypothetical protein